MKHLPFRRKKSVLYVFPDADSWQRITDPSSGQTIPLPPFATPEEASERAERVRLGRLHLIRLFPSHGRDWPLWGSDGNFTPEPADYGLSVELTERLRAWTDEWIDVANAVLQTDHPDDPYLMDPGWFQEGDLLAEMLAREVWYMADVAVTFRSSADFA